jgi:GT2 family glycosyltransferase
VSLLGILLLFPCVLLAFVACIVFVRLQLAEHGIPRVADGDQLPPASGLLSIVIPAHNEARVIEESVRTLRRQTFRNFEVIYVLDRCTDRTRELLVSAAAGDSRIGFIENHDCPADWAGKCNACRVGAATAKGEWILFTDADCRFEPNMLDAMLAIATERKTALLSAVGRLTFRRSFERLLQPVAALVLFRIFPLDKANRDVNRWPFANGQFLLFRRDEYLAVGGHELVKDALLEDLFFAWRLDRKGARLGVVDASERMEVSMYESAATMRSGWTRIFIECCNRRPQRLMAAAAELIFLSVILPVSAATAAAVGAIGLARGGEEPWTLFLAGICSIALALAVVSVIYARQRAPIVWAVAHPIAAFRVATWLASGARMLTRRVPIRWGGREYILEPRTRVAKDLRGSETTSSV